MVLTLKEAFENGKLIPQKNIREGRITENSFVVSFFKFLEGDADEMYQDPQQFFKLTHMTRNLQGILGESLDRLGTGKAKPLMVVDTTFGGGKTHTLVSLYHFYKSTWQIKDNEKIRELLEEKELNKIPEVSVVAMDCRDLSGISKENKTIWGEIGRQLGCYELVEEYDNKMQRPTTKLLTEMIESSDKPVLILMDELVNYLKDSSGIKVGDTNLSEITISFLHNITEAVSNTKNAMMILTLPGNEPSYKKEAELLEDFKESVRSIVAREGSFVVPLKKEDVYSIIKKRLFEHIDENLGTNVAEELQKFYAQNSIYLTEEAFSNEYFKSLERAYPFHPVIIDILYDRIATISEFNKTRGVLRLLSHVVKQVFQKRANLDVDFVITPGIIDLLDNSIFNELTNRIDRGEFQNVIRTDIVNDEHRARAQNLDGLLYMGPNVRIATVIYLYTLIGSTKDFSRGTNLNDIALAVSVPKYIYPGDVEESINKMDGIDGLWYFKQTAGNWYFTVDISIKKLINEAKNRISKIQTKKEIKSRLSRLLRTDIFDVRLWESDVRNPTKPTLVATDYDYYSSREGEEASESLKDIVQKEGQHFREKQNLIYLLVPRKGRISKMEDTVALYLAIKEIKTSQENKDELKTYKNKLEEYEKETNSNSNSTIELCYSMIFYPKGNDLKYITIQDGLEGAKNLPHKVYLALKKADKILEDLHPSFIADRVLQDKIITFSDLYERFQNNPSLPLPKNKEILKNSVDNGVIDGLFAVYTGSMQNIKENNEIDLCKFDNVVNNFIYKNMIKGGVKDAYHILPKAIADELSDKLNEIAENTKSCTSCNGRNSIDAIKCHCCGEHFEKEKYKICPYCKAENQLDATICIKCGESFEKAPEVDVCLSCGARNPKGTKKCEKCGKWLVKELINANSIEEFLEKVEGEHFKLKMVEFKLSNVQTLQALRFKLSTLTTGYNPKITASMKGENVDLRVKDVERIDVNELTDIIQRLSNLVQDEVLTSLKLEYEDGIDVSQIFDTFKSFKAFENDMEFKAAASTI